MEVLLPGLAWTAPVMVPLTTTTLGLSPAIAAVYCARVETVVVEPPLPPVVPPFNVAYPTDAASLTVARFSMVPRSSTSTVGVGAAKDREARARPKDTVENFILRTLELSKNI